MRSLKSSTTRFNCARKSWHVDHRGEIRATERDSHAYERYRAYGKAPTFSTQDTTQLKRAIDMTDDELVAIIAQAKAKLTVVK